jgi:hypothetical protein
LQNNKKKRSDWFSCVHCRHCPVGRNFPTGCLFQTRIRYFLFFFFLFSFLFFAANGSHFRVHPTKIQQSVLELFQLFTSTSAFLRLWPGQSA